MLIATKGGGLKSRAFTLTELLAVIIIIGVIALIATPVIISVIGKTERQAFERSIDGLLETVRLDYSTDSFVSPREYYYEGKDLILLTVADEVKDESVGMKGKIEGKGFIYIDEDGVIHIENICSKKYCANGEENKIEITENGSGVIPEVGKNDPIIRLIGEKTVYVNLNEVYEELGAVAKTKSGKELEYTKEITIPDTGEIVSEIDTSIENTYVITYKTSNEGKEASVTRTVVVLDMKPFIDIPEGSPDYVKAADILISASAKVSPNKITSFIVEIKKDREVMETKTVTGPSIIIELLETGIYEVKVIVTDSNNRTNTMTRTYKIDSEPPKITFAPETEIITLKENDVVGFDFKNDKTVTVTDNIELEKWWVEGALSAVAEDEIVKIKYVARDKAGNVAEEYRGFLVELADGPVFRFDSMGSNGKWIKATKVPFEVEIRGENNELTSLSYQIDNGSEVTKVNVEITDNKVMSVEVPLNTTGKYRITVKAKGRYGNETSIETGEYWIDAVTPTLTVRNDSVKYGTDKKLDTLYTATFGEMGGSVTCKNENDVVTNIKEIKQAGTYSIKCTAIGNNEKRSEEKTITLTLQNRTFPEIMSGTGRFNEEARSFEEVMRPLLGTSVANNDPDHNLRYVGANPNNYVSFNGELWRIIGLFDGQLKIVKNEPIEDMAYDENNQSEWKNSTLGKYLNNEYYKTISTESQEYIDAAHIWHIGGMKTADIKRETMYEQERGNDVYPERDTTWEGAIGLIYVSDYAYASNGGSVCNSAVLSSWNASWGDATISAECSNRSWLLPSAWLWTITPYTVKPTHAFHVYGSGGSTFDEVKHISQIRPALYLKSNIKIKSGMGTSGDPYKLTKTDIDTRDKDHNVRYVGRSPENYVELNGMLWRIIGMFDGQVKIIKATSIGDMAWDANNKNNWQTSSLQNYLNANYLMSLDQDYIDTTHEWNLGGSVNNNNREQFYEEERSSTSPIWIGAIGLMYASDYGYATSATNSECINGELRQWKYTGNVTNCKNNNWLWDTNTQYLLNPMSGNSFNVYYELGSGGVEYWTGWSVTQPFSIRPVLYLKNNVKIKGGTGTSGDPYILGK